MLYALDSVAEGGDCTPASLFEVGHLTIEAYTTDGDVVSVAKMGGMID